VFQVDLELEHPENENFKGEHAMEKNGKRDSNDGLHVVIGHQIHLAQSTLGLVDLVSNHDGSVGRISPCVSAGRRREASLKKPILNFSPIRLFQMQSGTWNNFDLEQK
jgi:hypothetical protein